MPPVKSGLKEIGVHGGKRDLERWGVFAEMMYLHGIGRTAAPPRKPDRSKGKQMLTQYPKWKAGLQDAYFDHIFKRIFIGEALNMVYRREARQRIAAKSKFITPQGITPQPGPKLNSTPGGFYGTFAGKIPAFDPRRTKDRPSKGQKLFSTKPISTKPGKKGGPGYVDITINKFPVWKPDKYYPKADKKKRSLITKAFRGGGYGGFFTKNPYLTPNWQTPTYNKTKEKKWVRSGKFLPPKSGTTIGGMKDGCFSKFPKHAPDKYAPLNQSSKTKKKDDMKKFIPCSAGKTWPLFSVAGLNIDFRTNSQNYRTMKPFTYTREFLHEIDF